jgi:putative transposase
MARPLRIEFPSALYPVTSRGDGREDIYLEEGDRQAWLGILGAVCERFRWVCHAYCQMTNHYHLLVETLETNLSRGMRQLNKVPRVQRQPVPPPLAYFDRTLLAVFCVTGTDTLCK